MSHILQRLGEAALAFRKVGEKTLPPIVSRRQAAAIKRQYDAAGKPWPYEHLYPGPAKNDPPYRDMFQKGHKNKIASEQRATDIAKKMDAMPEIVAAYRASQRVKWEEVPLIDRILLSRREIRDKYLKKSLQRR
jgi:hypothetical protein